MASYKNYKCGSYKYHKVGKFYQIDSEFQISLEDDTYRYVFTIYPGFRTDGGSIPWMFRWFAKPWKDDDLSYNGCFILHDACYASACVHRDLADDMLRSSLRDIGEDRLHASTICWCVNNFAKGHYGPENDDQDNYDFVKFNLFKK